MWCDPTLAHDGALPPEFEDGISESTLDRAAEFFEDSSVVAESRVLAEYATAMHDPTEGGLVNGLLEFASASAVALDVDRDAVPVRAETRALCDAMDVNPLRIFGSGALLAAVPADEADAALDALAGAGIEAADIGSVRASDVPGVRLDGDRVTSAVRDDLYALWE